MTVSVTLLYACLVGLVGLILGGLAGRTRSEANVSLGDGGRKDLLEAMRRQANWVENVPYAIILMALIEFNGANKTWLHVLGLILLASRIVHPFGLDADVMLKPARLVGAAGTFLVTLAAILTGLWQVLLR
jgi:uncharacterized protein